MAPQNNEDIFLNVELSRSSDELLREIIDNNFNLLEQFNKERENSLRFCVYGIASSKYGDLNDITISIETNHNDKLYIPNKPAELKRQESESVFSARLDGKNIYNIKTIDLSSGGILSKNIFKNKKASYFFLYEIDRDFNNPGETKDLILTINKSQEKIFDVEEVPFIYYDSDGERVEFGTDIVDIDLGGETQVIENDFPFLYGVHWIRRDINPPRPLKASFAVSETNPTNALTVEESNGPVTFTIGLEAPSLFGFEKLDIVPKVDSTIRNPNEDYIIQTKTIEWEVGEQYKDVVIDIVDDFFVEDTETVVFGFENLQYVEAGTVDTFILNIEDDDKPTPVGFEILSQEIVESGMTLNINLVLDRPIPVPNQTIDVVFNEQISTAIIGEDFENTGTEEAPSFRKQVAFTNGSSSQSFPIKILDDLRYEFDKNLVLNLENPTRNLEIKPSTSAHTIIIKDSMIKQYSTFIISGDSQSGFGIFRMGGPIDSANRKLKWTNNSRPDGFTNMFDYTIEIINKGEDIIVGDSIIGFNETVSSTKLRDGYNGMSVDLISNFDGDINARMFKKAKYQFVIKDIESLPGGNNPFAGPSFKKARNFPDVSTTFDALESGELGEFNYFMVSKINNLRTRIKPGSDSIDFSVSADCKNEIQGAAIDVEINGAILLNEEFTNPSFSFGGIFTEGTRLVKVKFQSEPAIPFYCTGQTADDFVSFTQLLPSTYPSKFNF